MPSSPKLTQLDPSRLQLPEKPALEGLEAKWMPRWEESGVYRFTRPASRAEVFSIDTPPPTLGQHNDDILRELGLQGAAVAS